MVEVTNDEVHEVTGPLDRSGLERALADHHARIEADGPPTQFRQLSLRDADLSGLDAANTHFDECDFSLSSFRGATLSGAVFTRTAMRQTDFSGAALVGTRFVDGCDLTLARLTDAAAMEAVFTGSVLDEADLTGADLQRADFEGTTVRNARLDRADLRGARHLIPDATSVRATVFSASADDLWSVLRRTYTGPRFLFNLLALVLFVGALAAKAYALYGIALIEAATTIKQPLTAWCARPEAACRSVSLVAVLLGWTEGLFAATFVMLSIVYNACRAVLTWLVAGMREEEDRSGRTPPYHALQTPAGAGWLARVSARLTGYRLLSHIHHIMWWFQWIVTAAFLAGLWDLASATLVLPARAP